MTLGRGCYPRPVTRHAAMLAALATLAIACRDEASPPTPRAQPVGADASELAADSPRGGLPQTRPTPFELDLRRRTETGDDIVFKVTDAGARYGLARGKSRVSLRMPLTAADLDEVYATLRDQRFDAIETMVAGTGPSAGSSIRLTAGPTRLSVSAMGRMVPKPEWVDAYTQCAKTIEDLLPRGRGEVVVRLRWDPSMAGKAAALDFNAGEGFVGLQRLPGELPNVEIHLAQPGSFELLVRHGSPPASTRHVIEAGKQPGIELAYDPEQDRVIVRPLGEAAKAP